MNGTGYDWSNNTRIVNNRSGWKDLMVESVVNKDIESQINVGEFQP